MWSEETVAVLYSVTTLLSLLSVASWVILERNEFTTAGLCVSVAVVVMLVVVMPWRGMSMRRPATANKFMIGASMIVTSQFVSILLHLFAAANYDTIMTRMAAICACYAWFISVHITIDTLRKKR
jgi:hypothetical protein